MEQREREPEHVLELLLQRVQRRALLVGHLLEDLSKGHASGLTQLSSSSPVSQTYIVLPKREHRYEVRTILNREFDEPKAVT